MSPFIFSLRGTGVLSLETVAFSLGAGASFLGAFTSSVNAPPILPIYKQDHSNRMYIKWEHNMDTQLRTILLEDSIYIMEFAELYTCIFSCQPQHYFLASRVFRKELGDIVPSSESKHTLIHLT